MTDLKRLNIFQSYGREYAGLFKLGLPILVTQAGIILVNFADTMMVAAYSTEALAAAAFVNSLFVIVTVMMIGFAAGMIPLIGALFGRKDNENAGRMFRAGFEVNFIVSVAFTVLMAVLYFFLDCFNQPPEIIPIARPYYLTILSSLIPLSFFNCCQQTANAINDTKTPMWFMLASNVLNIIGNYILIFGHFGMPEMGLTGAGISTFAARIAATVGILIAVWKGKRYAAYIPTLRQKLWCGHFRTKVWKTSYPVMIQNGIECALWAFGAIVSGWFGKIQLASYQVVNTIAQLGFMTFISFGVAVSVRVANNFGKGNLKAVKHTCFAGLHLNMVLASLASAIFVIGGNRMLGLFSPDVLVITAGSYLIPPLVLYQFADATQLTYVNALRGTGDVQPLLWISVISYIIVGIPLMLLLSVGLGWQNVGVYYSFNGSLIVAAAMLFLAFQRALRKHIAGLQD